MEIQTFHPLLHVPGATEVFWERDQNNVTVQLAGKCNLENDESLHNQQQSSHIYYHIYFRKNDHIVFIQYMVKLSEVGKCFATENIIHALKTVLAKICHVHFIYRFVQDFSLFS